MICTLSSVSLCTEVPQVRYQDPNSAPQAAAHRALLRGRSCAAGEKALPPEGQATFAHFRSCVKSALLDKAPLLGKMSAVWGNVLGFPLPSGPDAARSGWPSTVVRWASRMRSAIWGHSPASSTTLGGPG